LKREKKCWKVNKFIPYKLECWKVNKFIPYKLELGKRRWPTW